MKLDDNLLQHIRKLSTCWARCYVHTKYAMYVIHLSEITGCYWSAVEGIFLICLVWKGSKLESCVECTWKVPTFLQVNVCCDCQALLTTTDNGKYCSFIGSHDNKFQTKAWCRCNRIENRCHMMHKQLHHHSLSKVPQRKLCLLSAKTAIANQTALATKWQTESHSPTSTLNNQNPESDWLHRRRKNLFIDKKRCKSQSFMKHKRLLKVVGVCFSSFPIQPSSDKNCLTLPFIKSLSSICWQFPKFLIVTSTKKYILRSFYEFLWLCFPSCNSNSPLSWNEKSV